MLALIEENALKNKILPGSVCREIRRTLDISASRITRLVDVFPVKPLPHDVARSISAVLDSFDLLLKDRCGEKLGVTRHPSCQVTSESGACAPPLRLELRQAQLLCSAFQVEEERLDSLIDDIKQVAPQVDFEEWGPALAQAMGAIYVEILRPLQHQHPELKPRREEDDGAAP
jgi:hypothetical protein